MFDTKEDSSGSSLNNSCPVPVEEEVPISLFGHYSPALATSGSCERRLCQPMAHLLDI